jgi:hypothetical protein
VKSPLLRRVLSSAIAVCWLLIAPLPLVADSQPTAHEIVAFKHVMSIEPGHTKYAEAIKLLGQPEKAETTKEREVAGVKIGGTQILSYPSRGIFFIISEEGQGPAGPVIDGIYVESPFRGKTPNGLHLGMPKKEALEICDRDYFRTTDLGDSCYFATTRDGDSRFQLWFTDGRVSRMKIFAPLKCK